VADRFLCGIEQRFANQLIVYHGSPLISFAQAEISLSRSVAMSELRDPEDDKTRCQRPAWLVVVGVCPHMGCLPVLGGDYGGSVQLFCGLFLSS
jgi:Rieske Fe-S protein